MTVPRPMESRNHCLAVLALIVAAACGRGEGGGSGLGLQSHDSHFVVTGSHTTLSCDQCHDPAARGFSLADQGVSCTGCHTDAATTPAHSAVSGYAWNTATCIGCHKDGSGGLPPNHNADYFPVTGTKHAALGCRDCHGATKALADVTCVPCHTQSDSAAIHAAIPATTRGRLDGITRVNYQWTTPYCLTCHADGQVNSIASHPRFDHGLTGQGHAPFCLTCHTATTPAGGKAWSADFTKSSCLACHSSNNPG